MDLIFDWLKDPGIKIKDLKNHMIHGFSPVYIYVVDMLFTTMNYIHPPMYLDTVF